VTVKQYKQFCTATHRAMPSATHIDPNWSQEDHPIVNVSWNDAIAYCAWLSKETGYEVSLPTEAQWEKAACGTDGRKYPWGNEFDSSRLQCSKSRRADAGGTASVGSFPSGASPYGVLDMAGNVLQWCSDWYDENYYQTSPDHKPTGPGSGQDRVVRGQSWLNTGAIYFCCARRHGSVPWSYNMFTGFRYVVRADAH
jgi:sulfatase modifying factor 1